MSLPALGRDDVETPHAHHLQGQRAVRSARIGGVLMASVVLASCGANPVGPEAAVDNRPLRFIADPVVTMTQGETLTMRLEARGSGGRYTEQPAANYSWSSSNPSVVEASAGGVLRATDSGYGQATITARSSDGQTAETLRRRQSTRSRAFVPRTKIGLRCGHRPASKQARTSLSRSRTISPARARQAVPACSVHCRTRPRFTAAF